MPYFCLFCLTYSVGLVYIHALLLFSLQNQRANYPFLQRKFTANLKNNVAPTAIMSGLFFLSNETKSIMHSEKIHTLSLGYIAHSPVRTQVLAFNCDNGT